MIRVHNWRTLHLMSLDFSLWVTQQKETLETFLEQHLPKDSPKQLALAMRYAVLNHGKRIRPLLVSAAAKLGNADSLAKKQRMAAVELLHSYSLIHDDLPIMDDDNWRHGKASCHIVYGEAVALLAGDALQALAFEILCHPNQLSAENNMQALKILIQKAGFSGMVGGQTMDVMHTGKAISKEELIIMHRKKTGALIEASVQLGLLCATDIADDAIFAITNFAAKIGLAFQVTDDLLDYQANSDILGKTAGKDAIQQKATFVNLLGVDQTKIYVKELMTQAIDLLKPFLPKSQYLIDLAHFVLQRNY